MLKFNDYLKEAALSAKQKKIAAVAGDKDKIDAADLAALRAGKKPVEEASCDGKYMKKEELVGKQHKLDKNHNGKLDAQDFKMLRKEAKDGWSENDSLAKPVTSSQAMADHSKYFTKVTKLDPKTGEPIKKDVKEAVELEEGKMKDIYTSMMDHADKKGYKSHKEFTSTDYDTVGKQHGISGKELAVIAGHKTAQQAANEAVDTVKKAVSNPPPFDPDPKPAGKVTPGKYGQGPSQAKHLAKKGLASLTKEEAEDIEETSTITGKIVKGIARVGNELKDAGKGTAELGGQGLGAVAKTIGAIAALPGATKAAYQQGKANTYKSVAEEAEQIEEKLTQIDELSKKTLGSYVKRSANQAIIKSLANPKDDSDDMKTIAKREKGINLATSKLAKEEVSAEMSPYLKATLAVMDEGKIDNLRDTQALRAANKSAYDKDYKADDSHPHITLNKGTAYGGSNQKDDEGDEKPDNENQEKRGRGRPSGSKSGARQKGGGHEDGGIPVHNLHLPKSHK